MKLIALSLGFWLLFIYAVLQIYVRSGESFIITVLSLALYLSATCTLELAGYQWIWLRSCLLVRLLRALLSVPGAYVTPHAERQTLYAVEPHGESCHGFTTTFVPSLDGRVRVMAHSFFLYIPLLRDIYLLAGVVSASQQSCHACLDRGYDLAVIPSGLVGLYHSVITPRQFDAHGNEQKIIYIYRVNLGFCKLAIRRRLLLVPVLSVGEERAFHKVQLVSESPFFSTIVAPTFLPVRTLRAPAIDAAHFNDAQFEELAALYYAALVKLGTQEGYEVHVIERVRHSRHLLRERATDTPEVSDDSSKQANR